MKDRAITLGGLALQLAALAFSALLFTAQFDLKTPNFYVLSFILHAYFVEIFLVALVLVGALLWRERAFLKVLRRRAAPVLGRRTLVTALAIAGISATLSILAAKGEMRRDLAMVLRHPVRTAKVWVLQRDNLYGKSAVTMFRHAMFQSAAKALKEGKPDVAETYLSAAASFAPSLGDGAEEAKRASAWLTARKVYLANHKARARKVLGDQPISTLALYLLKLSNQLDPGAIDDDINFDALRVRTLSARRTASVLLNDCITTGAFEYAVTPDALSMANQTVLSVGDLPAIGSADSLDGWCLNAGDFAAALTLEARGGEVAKPMDVKIYAERYEHHLSTTWDWLLADPTTSQADTYGDDPSAGLQIYRADH